LGGDGDGGLTRTQWVGIMVERNTVGGDQGREGGDWRGFLLGG